MPGSVQHVAAVKPRFRGVLHQFAAPGVFVAAVLLAFEARTLSSRLAVLLFGVSLGATFAVSALYHRLPHGSDVVRERFRRADHATIFVGIAGSSTAVALMTLRAVWCLVFVVSVWLAACVGVVFATRPSRRCRRVADVLYGVVGWFAAVNLPALVGRAGWLTAGWVVASGLLFSVGAVLFASGRPRLRPLTFGYHEVWHVFTVAAAACHFVALWQLATLEVA